MLRVLTLITVFLFPAVANAADGLVTKRSPHSVDETMQRLISMLEKKGMRIFARVDHTEGARGVGKELRPTQLLIFGNPRVGTPLMQCSQTMAIDLPQKALVWKDAEGQVWLAYNAPKYLAQRHQMTGCEEALRKVSKALANFAKAATAP